MLTLTATATGALLVWAGLYAFTCWVWPFGPCPACHGEGKRRSWFSRRIFRLCKRCGATGRRLRFGRRVWIYLHRNRVNV